MNTEIEREERPRERSEKPQEWRETPGNLMHRAAPPWKPIVASGEDDAVTAAHEHDVESRKEGSSR